MGDVTSCPGCAERDQVIAGLEADLRSKRATITRLKNEADGAGRKPTDEEIGIFDYWRCATGHTQAVFTPKRLRAVRKIREQYPDDRILRAIDGAAAAPNVNDRTGEVYDDLELICRDGTKLESFEKRAPRTGQAELHRKLVGA